MSQIGRRGTGETEIILESPQDLDAVSAVIEQSYGLSAKMDLLGRESGSPGRNELHLEFWKQLLAKAKLRSRIHAAITPRKEHWISATAGKRGLAYVYIVRMKDAQVELSIDRGEGKWNKATFNAFYRNKQDIERVFGAPLDWQRS